MALAAPCAAQVAANRNTQYLFIADPADSRGVWVNPGALALSRTISVNADLTFGLQSPYSDGSPLRQLTLGFSSHFLAFAYQYDRLPDTLGGAGLHGHTYRAVLWGENGRLGAGAAATLYRGGDGGTGYDIGVAYRLMPMLDVGAVLANVGQPTVRGSELDFTWRPAATVHIGEMFAVQAQGDFESDGVNRFAFGTRLRVGRRRPFQLSARLDTDADLRRQSFSFGLTVGGESRGAFVATASGDLKQGEAVSFHGVSERSRGSRRGR